MKHDKYQKKRKRTLIVTTIFLFIILFFTFMGYRSIYPIYVETQKNILQIISGMNEGTFRREGNTYVYDKNKNKIGKIGNEHYSYVKAADISSYIKNGYVAQEDKKFATHHGVDFKALFRAGIAYIKNNGVIKQGGSTITQQVIKNNLLSSERSFSRKFTEILLAFEIEKTYTKAQILEFYCNSNYYGNGCYGVEGASKFYFGKSAKEVTLAEAAMIIGISNRPNDYNPLASYEKATAKKKSVLSSMFKEKYITKKEYTQAIKENPKVIAHSDNTDADNYMVSYALHCATLRLMEEQDFSFVYKFSSKKQYEQYKKNYSALYSECSEELRAGGYKIFTSFDPVLQKKLQDTVKKNISGDLEGAAVCIDNHTQMTVAVVGGKNEKDEYNRAFLSERNPGSSIKPLLDYGPAINEGIITPSSVLEDEKLDYHGYSPKNASGTYMGKVSVREALGRSLNTIAVKLFLTTGNERSLSYLEQMHFSSLSYADAHISSIALGGMTNGVKVIDMAKGYATLANQGRYSENNCIFKLEREDGSLVYKKNDIQKEVFTEDTAFMLTDMLQGVFREEYGTAHTSYKKGNIYAGKTGTTDNKDAWFCGYSTDYTTVVWVGCDQPRSIKGLTGSSYPAQIFTSFMLGISDHTKDFAVPDTIYLSDGKSHAFKPSYCTDYFINRPKIYDYQSELNEKRREEYLLQERIKKEKRIAETKVSDFEDYTIRNVEQAQSLDTIYQNVISIIEQIEDEKEQISFKERTVFQYNLLKKVVDGKWKNVIEEEETLRLQKKQLDMSKKAAASEDVAVQELQDKKKEIIDWYIGALYERKVNGSAAQQMIADAEKCLENYSEYDDYEHVRSELNAAIDYISSLPTQDEINAEKNTVVPPDPNIYPVDTPHS